MTDVLARATVGAALVACALAVWGVHSWVTGRARQQELVDRLTTPGTPHAPGRRRRFAGLDARVRRTRFGRGVERRLAVTGTDITPGEFTAALAAAMAAAWVAAQAALAPFFGPIAAGAALWGCFAFLSWRRQKRIEKFINQLPELSRVLANATSAGLALRTSIAMAAEELDAPAGEELAKVASALAVGQPVEEALGELQERLPSRELAVLVTTLILSSRAGGSLVGSLRNLTETLEERKETRREIRTQLSQVTVTAYTVPVIGVGSLLLIDNVRPGAIEAMTSSGLGRAAVVVALALYAVGFVLIRRMSRIDV
ncbi:type II secretion system F family protein [Streptomyces sp. NPDC059637]|uniref:type II secretion system F family protein n=1 Tax=Streptomyces sp. NPDC059637 TaxID=3347752 RepID=UPI0036A924C5